jgi:protein-S-isoprenylcysteine O-methyltransferase Ste14
MPLREELSKSGDFLFRWRSYLPLLMIVLVLSAMPNVEHPGHREKLDQLWEVFCLFISFAGLAIRVATIGYTPQGTSGTNTSRQIAEVLNKSGMYSATRNPLYLGNFIIWFGISMVPRMWWLCVIVVLMFWLYYERIIFAEEEFLRAKFGESFLAWAERTPVFVPSFRNWQSSEMTFSFRKVLSNEYKSFYATIIAYVVIELVSGVFAHHRLELDGMWLTILSVSSVFYVFVRVLKKKTTALDGASRTAGRAGR